MGRYEMAGREALAQNELYLSGNDEMDMLSLKVLDLIVENAEELPVKGVMEVLSNGKSSVVLTFGGLKSQFVFAVDFGFCGGRD